MENAKYKPAQPYDHSVKSFKRFRYMEKDRTAPLTLETLTFDRMGAMLETLVDALHIPLVMDEAKYTRAIVLPNASEIIREVEFIRPVHGNPPKYIIDTIGDYRAHQSFFRHDQVDEPNEPLRQKSQPHTPAKFAQEVHRKARIIAGQFGNKYNVSYFPAKVQSHRLEDDNEREVRQHKPAKAEEKFKKKLRDYKVVFDQYCKDPKNLTAEEAQLDDAQKKILLFGKFLKSDELKAYNDALFLVIKKTKTALSGDALKQCFVTVAGKQLKLDNTQLMDENFVASHPALILLALNSVGKHMTDFMYVPRQSFDFLTDVVGVESQITENTQALNRRITDALKRQHGITPDDDLLYDRDDRNHFVSEVSKNQRSIQLLYTFHKTAGHLERIYPPDKQNIAYQDMESMLKLAGVESPWLEELKTPQEIQTMLYAIERRLSLETHLPRQLKILQGPLREQTNNLRHYKKIEDITPTLHDKILDMLREIERVSSDYAIDIASTEHARTLVAQSFERIQAQLPKPSHVELVKSPKLEGNGQAR